MKMSVKKYSFVILFTSIFFCLSSLCEAKGQNESNELGYTVAPVLTSKQVDTEKPYFYIQTQPNEEQVLKVKVQSTRKEKVEVKIYVADAFTGQEATIEYGTQIQPDPSLKNPLSTLIQPETTSMTVANFEEKEAVFKVKMTPEHYDGVKMGVLVFERRDTVSKNEKLNNVFAYRIGVVTTETGEYYNDSKTLNFKNAKIKVVNGRKVISTILQNPEPKILSDINIIGELKKKGSSAVLKTTKIENGNMAPNSQLDFQIDYGLDDIKTGKYELLIKVANSFDDWEFKKELEITSETAKDLNNKTAIKLITATWIKVLSMVCYVLLIIICICLVLRRIKMEKEWNKRKKQSKSKNKKGSKKK